MKKLNNTYIFIMHNLGLKAGRNYSNTCFN